MSSSTIRRFSLFAAFASLALTAACGSKPSPPGPLQNIGGSAGSGPDDPSPGGSSGSGGAGGSAPLESDAGPSDAGVSGGGGQSSGDPDAGNDASAPDADVTPVVEEGCVIDTLDSECGQNGCPDLDEAPDWLLADEPVAVVRRPCEGADGTRFITIGASNGDLESGYIYHADSGELVASYGTSDTADFCVETTPSAVGFYGRVILDCASVNPNDVMTPCEDSSGPGSGGDGPEECIYIDN